MTQKNPPRSKAPAKAPAKPARKGPGKGGAKAAGKPLQGAGDGEVMPGDRIAKVLARAGVASRREAERMIEAGRVTVNGVVIDSPALNVTGGARITVDGKPVGAPEPARLWLYHKPAGLVTTTSDEKGRETIFDRLPEDLPRVMSVGRLDLNSEGLLLLTNDGGIKRQLELPATGWMRKYRVRVKGNPSDEMLEPLREGVVVDRETFQPMVVNLDRQQGANAWLTVGLREGRNREIRRAMESVGLVVNRLIRVSYGPFQLGSLKEGQVEEVRRRVMRDQLGLEDDAGEGEAVAKKKVVRKSRPPKPKPDDIVARPMPRKGRPGAGGKPGGAPGGAAGKPGGATGGWQGKVFTGKGVRAGASGASGKSLGKGGSSGGAKGPKGRK